MARGHLYGVSLRGVRLGAPIVYHGTFGSGLFQSVYQPGRAHWAMLPSNLEWHAAAAAVALAGVTFASPLALGVAAVMVALAGVVAVLQAAQARIPAAHDGLRSRSLVAVLCYAQPLVRSWARYRTRWFAPRPVSGVPEGPAGRDHRLPLSGRRAVAYWSEEGVDRTALLGLAVAYFDEHRWGKVVDSGWSAFDLEIHGYRWTTLRVLTVQEEHGGGRRLIRVGYTLKTDAYLQAILAAAALGLLVAPVSPLGAIATSAALGAGPGPLVARGPPGVDRAADHRQAGRRGPDGPLPGTARGGGAPAMSDTTSAVGRGGESDLNVYRRLMRLARPYWPQIVGLLLLSLLAPPLVLLVPVPLKIAVDSALGGRPLPGVLDRLGLAGSPMRLTATS